MKHDEIQPRAKGSFVACRGRKICQDIVFNDSNSQKNILKVCDNTYWCSFVKKVSNTQRKTRFRSYTLICGLLGPLFGQKPHWRAVGAPIPWAGPMWAHGSPRAWLAALQPDWLWHEGGELEFETATRGGHPQGFLRFLPSSPFNDSSKCAKYFE